jgi:ubiquitin-conjugating enzyme E2 A|mmetsp:Transcript_3568/g.10951  ORF Transcript_3568/g.10951 Transcript_3568/m.10951 type:complete len:138 (+) Transcript_3568:799-1212(+)
MRTNEHEQGCSASPHSDDNLFVWSATICGPQDSPWEGGIFSLRLTFSDAYPATAPRVRFVSEMFHPNIYPDGTLCMDTIQDQWSPVHSVASLLTSVRSLLCDPNVNSPANPQAAKMFVEEEKEYNKRVRRLARKTVE